MRNQEKITRINESVIKVGDELVLSNFWDSTVVKVISRTKFTAKVAVYREFFQNIL